ncbi:MAG: hypothetical protein CMH52_04950 [Myxococcales bacterium]|nr:hypothetical protein [Myxococcales bacterium]
MLYRRFGQVAFDASVIGFGAASISGDGGGYSFGQITDDASVELVHTSQDLGINVFDTAPIYGFGQSEQRLGSALRGSRRDKAFIASKCGITWDQQRRVRIDNSASTTRNMLEQSLRRLDTDWLDLYLVHWPDPEVDIRETYEVLVRAKEEGKVRAIGLSNTNQAELTLAQEVGPVEICQGQDSFFESWNRRTLFKGFQDENVGFMAWGTLEKGILTGRVTPTREYDSDDVRSHAPWWTETDHSKHFRVMKRVQILLEDNGHTGLDLALSHVLRADAVSTALCGARTPEQVRGLVAALNHPLSDDLVRECDAVRSEIMDS